MGGSAAHRKLRKKGKYVEHTERVLHPPTKPQSAMPASHVDRRRETGSHPPTKPESATLVATETEEE